MVGWLLGWKGVCLINRAIYPLSRIGYALKKDRFSSYVGVSFGSEVEGEKENCVCHSDWKGYTPRDAAPQCSVQRIENPSL
jgi:hypothetical protein